MAIPAFTQEMKESKLTSFKKIENGIYILWYDEYQNKSIVSEFKDFLVLTEFPNNDTVSIEVIMFLEKTFPKKKLRYVLHSHHHGHSISSFDPFLQKTNAQLITTPYNYSVIQSLTKDTTSLFKRTILIDSTYEIADKSTTLSVFSISQKNYPVPTKEYMVFDYPMQKTFISGCLYNKPLTYHELVNQRKTALKKFLIDKKLSPQLLIPTNTSKKNDFEDICTIGMLDSTLRYGLQPDSFVMSIKNKDVQYLTSRMDSLIGECKKIPRSYDYIVCAKYLIIEKEYVRAIVLLKALMTIHPNDDIIYYFIGNCYEKMNFIMEAIAYYQKYMTIVKDQNEITETKLLIDKLSKQIN